MRAFAVSYAANARIVFARNSMKLHVLEFGRSRLIAGIFVGTLVTPGVAQTTPPADWGPVSVDVADVPYPYPVQTLSFTFYGQPVRMAYMDVKPSGTSNGQTVVLLHGY